MSAAAGIRLCFNATMNRNTGNYGTPVWSAVGLVDDLTLDCTFEEADASIRGSGGYKFTEPTLQVLQLEFGLKCVPSDAGYIALRANFLSTPRAVQDVLISTINSNTTGEFTLRADYKCVKFGQEEKLAGIIVNPVTLKPCYSANPVVWTTN